MRTPSLGKRELFLVLQVSLQNIHGLLLSVDPSRVIRPIKYWEHFEWAKWSAKLSPFKVLPKVIVSVHPSLLETHLITASLGREHPERELSKIEFQNLLAKLVTDILATERAKAAEYFNEDELHTILVNVRARSLTVDGKETLSPVGLPAKKIDGVFEVSFTRRELFDHWRSFFSVPHRFFFTGTAQAHVAVLEKISPLPVEFVFAENDSSTLFSLSSRTRAWSLKSSKLQWSVEPLLQHLRQAWSVEERTAMELYESIARGKTSERVRALFVSQLNASAESLTSELKKVKSQGDVFVGGPAETSFLDSQSRDGVTLHSVPADEIFERLGFVLKAKTRLHLPKDLFSYLAPFMEFYYDKNTYFANSWLKSRVHWLSPSN